MKGLLAAAPLATAVLAAALAAPVPEVGPPEYLADIRPGARFEYECGPEKGSRWAAELVVTKVERKGRATVVTLGDAETWSADADGLYQVARHGQPFTPARRLIKLPARAGDEWKSDTAVGETRLRGSNKTRGLEWVEVPAGRFLAAKVEFDGTQDGRPSPGTAWYAPDVGLVKQVLGGHVEVLKAYTPGKG